MNFRSMEKNTHSFNLIEGPVGNTLLRFSLPFMASTLLQTLYSTTDTIVVGQCLGSPGLSAVSNASQLMQLLYMVCVGFSSAGQVLIAQAVGAGNYEKVQKVIHTLFVSELLLSLATGMICMVFARPLLSILSTPKEAAAQAAYYIIICGAGMVFTGLYNMFSAILRGCGDSRHPLLFVAIASVINIILDLLFIAGFGWNVAGAALATIIGQLFSVIFSFYFCKKHADALHFSLNLRELRIDSEANRQLIRIGVPLAVQSGAVQLSFLFVSRMVNTLGLTVSAAFGAAQKLRNIPGILGQGLSLGCASMIGQNWGARKNERVSSTVRWGLLYSFIINAVFTAIFAAAPILCFRMFTQDTSVLTYAPMCIFALIAERPGQWLMAPCNALVNAQGFVKFSIIVGFVDAFVGRIFLCWFFGTCLRMGALGFFLGYSGGTYLTAIPVFIYYVTGLWKRRSVLS